MFSIRWEKPAALLPVACTLLALASLHVADARAQGVDLKAMCRLYPDGIRRAGCVQDMGIKQALIDAADNGDQLAPARTAEAMATLSVQAVLALDTTIRHWQALGEWAWEAGAHRPSFHAIEAMGGQHHPPQIMDCPGGGTMGLIDNAGGTRTIESHGSLPSVDVTLGKDCRVTAEGPAVTAVAPDIEFTTHFSVPDEVGKQLVTHPMFLMFNSAPRLSSMPSWIPSGTAGELVMAQGRIKLYGETPAESDRGLSFIFWPQQAHARDHRPYASVSLRVDANTPGVGAAQCIADGRRCLMLDTGVAAPDRVIAHFDLSGNVVAGPRASASLANIRLAVDTARALVMGEVDGQLTLLAGQLVVRSIPLIPGSQGITGETWDLTLEPGVVDGRHIVQVDWKRRGGGRPDAAGKQSMAQGTIVSLPHYCATGENGWGCVATDYYPDYSM